MENITPLVLKYDLDSQNLLLTRIKSKLRGKAREVIEINNHVKVWSEIKTILINNFGDKKSTLQIFDELRSVTFTSNSVDLYNQIKNILRRLNNKAKDEPNSELTIIANIETGLKVFKNKLPEPMRSILFSRNPTTLEGALDILFEGNYAYYNPSRNNSYNNRNPRGREQNKENPQKPHYGSRPSNDNYKNPNFKQNQQLNPNPNTSRPEPMDVDRSINSRVHSLETQNQIENFHLEASENKNNHFLI